MSENRYLMRKLNRLSLLHRVMMLKAISSYGLYLGQLPILDYIIQHVACTQKEIADFMQISAPSIATSLKRMQKVGFIKKETDEFDLRINRLYVSDRGKEVAELCHMEFKKMNEQLFQGFQDEEIMQLSQYMDRMIHNIFGEEKQVTYASLIEQELALRKQEEEENND